MRKVEKVKTNLEESKMSYRDKIEKESKTIEVGNKSPKRKWKESTIS